ncbi:hypothetical protein A2Y99_00495 [Candidatus Gottesmanbacteria bacterium RBG_13_37_7]|uniref:Cell shape-determining protein MreC n=1 Tax=Candidatus Gottesmanbacteria bacterium RBG_13_37_7 TaxID=1798369 RepID=A0A1F5YIN3_9BACT|nr:MAG: hypothetical protein A2Y99_00495 [Candidatus Gottesmanbacteria bacterium RBG_13_37_7]
MYKDNKFWLIVCSLLILLLDRTGAFKQFKNTSEIFTSSVKSEIHLIKSNFLDLTNFVRKYPDYINIVSESDKLKKEMLELDYQVKELQAENDALRTQIGASSVITFKYIPAPVLSVSRFMEIGVGEKDKIYIGMPVVIGDTLVGKIKEVSERNSIVMLPTDSESQITVKTSRGVKGILSGQSGNGIVMEKVLQKDPLILDDLVVTDGQDDFPPNIIIGKVVHITVSDVDVYKKAKVDPIIDYQKEHTVFIIRQ